MLRAAAVDESRTPAAADGGVPPAAALAIARTLPKVLLHEHLDGGLRPQTLLEELDRRGRAAPARDAAALARWFDAQAHAGSLEAYLRGFALTVAAMAAPDALARVAREAALDARDDGVVLAEFRIAPLLFEPFGLAPEAAVEALLDGLSAAPGLPCGLVVCAMRHEPAAHIARAARLAVEAARRDPTRGGARVVGFDLAGAEAGFPATPHAALLRAVRDAGLGLTLHAGEADAGPRVLEAIALGAARIGHGVRLIDLLDDPAQRGASLDAVHGAGVHLEVCPTSNVHTGAAPSLAAHPIGRLWRAGVPLSFHTDNRLISCTTPSLEAARLVATPALGLHWADLRAMGEQAAHASFLDADVRTAAAARVAAWVPPPATPGGDGRAAGDADARAMAPRGTPR